MNIRIIENGEMKDLTIRDSNNIEWTYDLLGNNNATVYNEGLEVHEMSQEDFDWWEEYISNHENDEEQLVELAEELNIDEQIIRDRIIEDTALSTDLVDEHSIKQNVFEEIKKEKTEIIGKTWGEITEEKRKELLHCARAVSGVDGGSIQNGDCIVDFEGYNFSIQGFLVNNEEEREIIIADDSVFYDPTV